LGFTKKGCAADHGQPKGLPVDAKNDRAGHQGKTNERGQQRPVIERPGAPCEPRRQHDAPGFEIIDRDGLYRPAPRETKAILAAHREKGRNVENLAGPKRVPGADRAAVAMGKALVYRQRELGLEAAYQLAGQTMAVNMMDAAAQEGARAFAEKRKPDWKC